MNYKLTLEKIYRILAKNSNNVKIQFNRKKLSYILNINNMLLLLLVNK